jgi:hypothetical protein
LTDLKLTKKPGRFGYNYYELPDGTSFHRQDVDRDDPHLVQVVETLGPDCGGWVSSLKVVEIPDDVKWQIEEYDGSEWVAECHRTWS